MPTSDDLLDQACRAMLDLAAHTPWREVTLLAVAEKAGLPLADLFAKADGKAALLAHLSARFDEAALATAANRSEDAHDRLFDAVMARVEIMAPDRDALIAIARADSVVSLLPHFPRTARAILEAAGVEASALRLAAMTAVWARVAQVWRDDEGALNRTMAEIDKRLKEMRRRLAYVGGGF